MSQNFYFLYQEFLLESTHTIENMQFLTNVVQELFIAELSKFGGSHEKGNKNKIISKFESINDLENYLLNLLVLFEKFKSANQAHDFHCLSFVCATNALDKQSLLVIKQASSIGLKPSYLYSNLDLALSKFQQDTDSLSSQYFQYSILSESDFDDDQKQSSKKYKAIVPKIFGLIIIFMIIVKLVSLAMIYMGSKYDDMRYSKLDQALAKEDTFSLYQNLLKFEEGEIDDKFGYYIDKLIQTSVYRPNSKNTTQYTVLKERTLALEAKFKSFPPVRLYSNLIGLYEKSLEGEISFHEINQLLTQSKSFDQSYTILALSLDFNVKKFQLIQKAIKVDLKDEDRLYLLTLLFQSSLEESIDGRYEYYKSLIENHEDPNFKSILQKNLIDPKLNKRRNSYKLLVQLQALEGYQFSQFIRYELNQSSDFQELSHLISNFHPHSLKREVLPSLELIYKKAKRAKSSTDSLDKIQTYMKSFKIN